MAIVSTLTQRILSGKRVNEWDDTISSYFRTGANHDATIPFPLHRSQRIRLVATSCTTTGPTADSRKGRDAAREHLDDPAQSCHPDNSGRWPGCWLSALRRAAAQQPQRRRECRQ